MCGHATSVVKTVGMDVRIVEEPISSGLAEHGTVSIAFSVVRADGSRWTKDYDAVDGPPTRWLARWDVSSWGLLVARAGDDDARIGGAVVAWDTEGLDMLRGHRELAVVWDLRVAPAWRGRGVGAQLWRAAESWALARGCTALEVETQDVNAGACAFYERMGCVLSSVRPDAYPELPDEVQHIYRRSLTS